jgi:tRNA threonylcarbamoyladenosine biosynthesis protein TsaB
MKIIAIDTATEACSAAFLLDGEIVSRYELAPRTHTERLLPMLDELLAETQLKLKDFDALAFGRGPGSFTGVRIAAAAAQGIAFSADLPVIAVSTLAAMAQRAIDELSADAILTAIDARMNEVYWGAYQKDSTGLAKAMVDESVIPPEKVTVKETGNWLGVGTGWGTYAEALAEQLSHQEIKVEAEFYPDAVSICRLAEPLLLAGKIVPAEQAIPVYLRNNVAKKKQDRS